MTPTREQVIEWEEIAHNHADEQEVEAGGDWSRLFYEKFAALAYSAGRLKGREEAKEVCYGERVADTGEESDAAYNAAIDHCAAAIDQLKEQK